MHSDCYGIVKELLVTRFAIPSEKIQPTADLHRDLQLDSVDAMDLLMAVNKRFTIRISETVIEKIHTVSDLAEAIKASKPTW